MPEPLLIAKSGDLQLTLLPGMANRHGLVAGATGTGKTVTLEVMAEAFSSIGVPVFAADVKGDLSGIAEPGAATDKLDARIQSLGLGSYSFRGCPVTFWDVFGEEGHPLRTTVSEIGPLLFARILNLNETQAAVLTLVFKIADDQGLLLLDLKDLKAMLSAVGANAKTYQTEYGNISSASIGAIQRGLVALEQQGGAKFLGEPALNIDDLLQTVNGRGVVNLLAADKLMQSPQLYATFLLWLLSELYEHLPEAGDLPKPKLVFFFDEAHLLFNDLPAQLSQKIEQVVRLIRSKGVGIYFVTQNPADVPPVVLSQLGNRVQHALRAFTPQDQKAVRVAAQTFRANPKLDTEQAISQLAVGEALVSFLDENGTPQMVERALVVPPHARIGPVTPEERKDLMARSVVAGVYEQAVDRESAYERLQGKATAGSAAPVNAPVPTVAPSTPAPDGSTASSTGGGWFHEITQVLTQRGPTGPRGGRGSDSILDTVTKSAARAAASTAGRQIMRGVLGSLLGGALGGSRRR
ncbi:helicase HerA-like domain-containing protein [Terriglobus sp.]|uniref:helicase HerA-like domain-containing protein n=1 Tax=Terriglobus sp. TaxID=1889013 RepID=UPI003AFF8280